MSDAAGVSRAGRAPEGQPGKGRPAPLDEEGFRHSMRGLHPVSRETGARLRRYLELLQTWQKAVNLVGAGTLADPWRRHILDSAQLYPLLPEPGPGPTTLADLGSGAGFPGMVLAILAAGARELAVHLIEADGRKCAFLREVARVTGVPVALHNARIERLDPAALVGPGRADVVTARGLAPLPRLLELAVPFLGPGGIALLLKGKGAKEELTRAANHWHMSCDMIPSLSDRAGVVLKLSEIVRVPG